jgi:4-aminobutyrate aminotransferase-like enzyme
VTAVSACEFAERAFAAGLRILPAGPDSIRAIPYLNIGRDQILQAVHILRAL